MNSGVCVVGRADFRTGIGAITLAALELFSRGTNVSFAPTRGGTSGSWMDLPTGRRVRVADETRGFAAYFYGDILWNGASDLNHLRIPSDGLRMAYMAFDSDQLPPEWVTILNERFDVLLCSAEYLEEVARASGVTISIATLPLALDTDALVATPFGRARGGKVRFGTVSAFHQRKGLDLLVDAFIDAFPNDEDVELVIHSNLAMGDTYQRVKARADGATGTRIRLSHGNLTEDDKNRLIESFDVYVSTSAGEGYSIGPREALSLGKPLVLSDLPPHRDLAGVPGVTLVPPIARVPARYPEIDNRVFGTQARFARAAVADALKASRDFALSPEATQTASERKARAAEFTFTTLEPDYRRLVDPTAPVGGAGKGSSFTRIPDDARVLATAAAGRHGRSVGRKKLIVPSHDAGFFSLFNVFASHLTWSKQELSPPMVIPDWDVSRLIERTGLSQLVSYCYSQPSDGNMWLHLFEPLYDLDPSEMNDPEFLYAGGEVPEALYNEHKEPLLTYTNAFDLYRAPWFSRFRTQYNRAVRDHVRLLPHLQSEVDQFTASFRERFVVAAHVKHPSHSVEQPGGTIAQRHQYVSEVRAALAQRGIKEGSDDWGVFLATDQDRVLDLFRQEFGEHVIRFADVVRIEAAVDEAYDQLSEDDRNKEGHQLQHIMASDSTRWSPRLAWEVWRDAEAMAASDVLIHAVSNVATAVSYLGKDVQMVYCQPDGEDV